MLSPGAFRDIVVRPQYSDMAMKVEAARLMVYTAAARARRGEPTLSFISSAAAKEARRGGTAPSSAERSGAGKPEILTINGLGRFDAELGDQHADGLADLGAAQRVKFGPGIALWVVDCGLEVVVHEVEQREAGDFGGGDGPRRNGPPSRRPGERGRDPGRRRSPRCRSRTARTRAASGRRRIPTVEKFKAAVERERLAAIRLTPCG